MQKKDIGIRLKIFRKKKKIKQQELAFCLKISRASISMIENGKNALTIEHLIKVIINYKISFQWLIFGIGDIDISPSLYNDLLNSTTLHNSLSNPQEKNITNITSSKEQKKPELCTKQQISIPFSDAMPLYKTIPTHKGFFLKDLYYLSHSYIHIPNTPLCDGATVVQEGNDAYPILRVGDIITYKILPNTKQIFYDNHLYIISIYIPKASQIVIRYIQSTKKSSCLKLKSHNQQYPTVCIPLKYIKGIAKITMIINKI